MKPKLTHSVWYIIVKMRPGATDMLRYDNCLPATEVESTLFERDVFENSYEWVILKRFVLGGAKQDPTVERWRSFGVECYPRAIADYYQAKEIRDSLAAQKSDVNIAQFISKGQ